MRKLADNFVSPAAQLMNADGSFTDLFYKLMYDQPIKSMLLQMSASDLDVADSSIVNGQAIKP